VKEKLGLKELIAIGVGGMIGGGIFSVLGVAVGFSGSGAPLSFLIDMLIALTAGYHYVKLALTFMDDGASYTYLRRAFPEKPWIAGIEGWVVIVGYVGTLALYAFTFGAYGAELLGAPSSLSSAINSTLFGACRMMAEMAEDGIMPSLLARRNEKGVPHYALSVLTLSALLFTFFGTLNVIAEFSSLTFLLVSIGVSVANLRLRHLTKPNLFLALLGLILMTVTVITLVFYLAVTNLREILIISSLYFLVSLFAVFYIKTAEG